MLCLVLKQIVCRFHRGLAEMVVLPGAVPIAIVVVVVVMVLMVMMVVVVMMR